MRSSQQVGDRQPGDRIDQVWRKIRERFEDEAPLPESQVRDDEVRLRNNSIPE